MLYITYLYYVSHGRQWDRFFFLASILITPQMELPNASRADYCKFLGCSLPHWMQFYQPRIFFPSFCLSNHKFLCLPPFWSSPPEGFLSSFRCIRRSISSPSAVSMTALSPLYGEHRFISEISLRTELPSFLVPLSLYTEDSREKVSDKNCWTDNDAGANSYVNNQL